MAIVSKDRVEVFRTVVLGDLLNDTDDDMDSKTLGEVVVFPDAVRDIVVLSASESVVDRENERERKLVIVDDMDGETATDGVEVRYTLQEALTVAVSISVAVGVTNSEAVGLDEKEPVSFVVWLNERVAVRLTLRDAVRLELQDWLGDGVGGGVIVNETVKLIV